MGAIFNPKFNDQMEVAIRNETDLTGVKYELFSKLGLVLEPSRVYLEQSYGEDSFLVSGMGLSMINDRNQFR